MACCNPTGSSAAQPYGTQMRPIKIAPPRTIRFALCRGAEGLSGWGSYITIYRYSRLEVGLLITFVGLVLLRVPGLLAAVEVVAGVQWDPQQGLQWVLLPFGS